MENDFTKLQQAIAERSKRKLGKMLPAEKAEYAKKERKRTFWWLGISLFCCIAWISSMFETSSAPSDTADNPIVSLIIATAIGLAIAIIMIMKLFKKEEQLALIRITRETKKELKLEMEKKKVQDAVGDDFVISKAVPLSEQGAKNAKLVIDNEHRQFAYVSDKFSSKKYNFSDIINYEIYENGNSKVQGRAGSALIGATFFGLGGAIIGSSRGRAVNEKCNQLKLIIRLNDFDNPQIIIPYIDNVSWDKSGAIYRGMMENLQAVCSNLEYMINAKTLEESSVEKEETTENRIEPKQKKEQLQELKEMLDDGLISEEDFEKKKNQILGL